MRYIHSCLIAIIFLMSWEDARATHIYGADFFYEHVVGYTYRVSLVVYGDCKGRAFPNLAGSTPQVSLLNNGNWVSDMDLNLTGAGVEVTPVCPAQKNNTTCTDTTNPVPGVTRYIYSNLVTLPFPRISATWVFQFGGDMGNSQTGRTAAMTNINNSSGTSLMVLEADLNNLNGPNSSPRFTTIPTPFYCINVPQQYNQGAVDPNRDSLVYSLAPGQEASGTVSYKPGFSATAPLAVTPGAFSFSSSTGQLNFTPNTVQQSLVVNKVTEYRNGVIVGTASREMTFIVLANCNNTPSASRLDTLASANTKASIPVNASTVNICLGEDSARFSVIPVNPAGDTIFATVNGLPPGATATILRNNTLFPVIVIDWNLPSLPAGSYNFFVTYKDNGCPLSSVQTQAYTVQVILPNTMTTTILAPTNCFHQAYVRYNFAHGQVPRIINISKNGSFVRSYVDNSGTLSDSLGAGTYAISVSSPKLPCIDYFNLTIVDSGIYPIRPSVAPVFYCLNDEPVQLTAGFDSGAILKWYTAWGMQLPNAPTPRTDSTGIFVWYVNQRVKVCESRRDSIQVYVTKRPIASINIPPSICLNDTVSIFFDGSIGVGPILEYFWDWDGAGYTVGEGAGPWLVHWFSPGTKTVRLSVAENKCSSDEVEKTIVVRPAPYAGFNAYNEICQFDTFRVSYNTNPFRGQLFNWNFDGADTPFATGPGPYLLRWDTAGPKRISLTINLDGCFDTRMRDIEVRPAPQARILNAPGPICIGDKIYLQATGGDRYTWLPKESLLAGPDGNMYAQILKPVVYTVLAETDYGCLDSAAITYDRIEPCCNFSYPNAFTPNGDGRNDRFRIVTYGNHLRYELSIYNNWGQRVYYGLDANEGWDGKFKGKVCDAGTYFYYLNATCFTGHQETHKGDLMLVR